MMNVLLRQPASARDCAGELIEYSESVGLPLWSAYGRVYAGWAMMAKGHFREARTAIVTGLAMLEQTGNRRNSTLLFTWAAQAEMHNDNPDEAMNWLMKAFAILDATNDVIWAPELYRTRGEIALQFRGDAVGAERDFQTALDLARRHNSKMFELRAATSLARLWSEKGKRVEAGDLLSPICGWFTEGFTVPDLIDARSLLSELN